MLGVGGVIAMETSVAAVTVSDIDPEIVPQVAEMLVEPVPTEVANPFELPALLMAATDGEDELQVTVVVRICVEPLE
jgi:hypothetical protein